MCSNESGRLESRPLVLSRMVAPPAGLEPATSGFRDRCSQGLSGLQLSYGGVTTNLRIAMDSIQGPVASDDQPLSSLSPIKSGMSS